MKMNRSVLTACALLCACAMFTGYAADHEKGTAVPLEIYGVLKWSHEHKGESHHVFSNADQMAAVWVADGGKKDDLPRAFDEVGEIRVFEKEKEKEGEKKEPRVDFRKHMVVAALGGGDHIEKAFYDSATKTLSVIYKDGGKGNHAVVMKKAHYEGEPRFVKAGSDDAAKLEAGAKAAATEDKKVEKKEKVAKKEGKSEKKEKKTKKATTDESKDEEADY